LLAISLRENPKLTLYVRLKEAKVEKMKQFRTILLLLLALATIYCHGNSTPTVLVSVAPYKNFVEKVAGDTIEVILMVPAGSSSHTYEPSPKQMLNASGADIWFQIGEGFEARAGSALKNYSKDMQFVNLRQGLDLIVCQEGESGRCACVQHHDCVDPHFWMSPKEVIIQSKIIIATLAKRYPEHKQLYERNGEKLIQELEALNQEIAALLAPLKNRTILVSHPAYAYFCRDYNLKQLSIEFEGKDPTPKQLTNILAAARKEQIRRIYIQAQYSSKGARLIAKEIDAEIVTLDPYAENFFPNMLEIARSFAKQ